MSDWLLDVSQNPYAKKLVKSLGLPIPLPEKLRRERGPWSATPLFDLDVLVGGAGDLGPVLAEILAPAGANPWIDGGPGAIAPFTAPGEVYGRPARPASALAEGRRVDALVLDATGIADAAGLRALYDFFHAHVGRLGRSGRVLVLGRPGAAGPEAAAAQSALDGFVRSVAKEMGRTGVTSNLVLVAKGAEPRLAGVLRFLLSPRSAFITAQPVVVTAEARAIAEPAFVRPLEKKVALVTGAARGIGAATAKALAREGAHVICLDRPADDAPTSQLAREIGGTPLLLDMTADDAPARIVAAVKEKGGLDVVVQNAGITRDKTIARMKPELWDQVLDVNLGAVLRTTAALTRDGMKDGGRVVCLASIAGIAGNVGQTSYAASKAGIIGFVRALAPELAARGITVNAIAPGFIETRLTAAIPPAIREAGRRLSALGQGGLPDDVAEAITFLASPGSQGITGRILRVCGGAFLGA